MQGSCVSCGQGLVGKGSTLFPCPNCDSEVGRCGDCREQAVHYACVGCSHPGP